MTKVDPIIAVKEIKTSADWYEKIFGFKNAHGGDDFAVLVTEADEVIICLHKWATHGHPSLTHSDKPSEWFVALFQDGRSGSYQKESERKWRKD